MRRLFFILLSAVSCFLAEAHSGKARFHVIIDTDGAADDLRAICMLLGNREAEVLAITASEGALTPETGAWKVKALLHCFHHEGIPVGAGRRLDIQPPAWRRQSEGIRWGSPEGVTASGLSAKDLTIKTLESEAEKVIFVCLGTLTNLCDALTDKPELKEHIDRIVWYGSANPLSGANYEADPASADKVLASGVKVDIVSGKRSISINKQYISMIANIDNVYARKIVETHSAETLKPVVDAEHMKAWDDLTVVFLFAPELFASDKAGRYAVVHSLKERAEEEAKQAIVHILRGNPDGESRVFDVFPETPGLFAADVAPLVKDIVARHGHSEWRAGALANELHGHLGIYAIVGVKMGIRAREYFNIGVDDISVTSYAGRQPPVSCMNDGLQVSTGGTVGHGLMTVATGEPVRPEASFSFKGSTLRMKLKPAYAQQIRKDVEEGIRLHGNLTESYWQYVRTLALRYWLEFDREEMFETESYIQD